MSTNASIAASTAALGISAAVAAAAYLDGKFNIQQDLVTINERRRVGKVSQQNAEAKRLSPWYAFESHVQRVPDSPCLWYRANPSNDAVEYTFQETYDYSCQWAAHLLDHGVRPGDLVAIYMQNRPEFMIHTLACWALGTAPALINYHLSGDGLVHCIKIAGSRVIVVDEDSEIRQRIEDVRSRLETELDMKIIIIDATTKAKMSKLPCTRPLDSYRDTLQPTSPMLLFYTSGSTGLPKACALQVIRAPVLSFPRLRTNNLTAHPNGDTWYNCMPLYHGTSFSSAISCLMSGLTLAIGSKFSVRNFWHDIHDSHANCFVYVGETARYLLAAPPSPLDKTHQLKSMYGNGMRPDVFMRFKERFNIPRINEFFNSTEGMLSLLNVCRNEYLAGCVGHFGAIQRFTFRNHLVTVKIDHENGDTIWRDPTTGFAQRTPYEQGGEVLVRCAEEADFTGYYNNPEATQKRFERDVFAQGDLYYRTGDALRMDRDGRWYFLDRLGDTFRWKSENVSTAEVSEVLGRFPSLVEANVYGVEVPGSDGRAGCAAIYISPENRESFDYSGFLAHARSSLPKYAVPVFLRVIKSPTPMHNNKQNKVPLRNEGVDVAKVKSGKAGPEDLILWLRPKSDAYEPFSETDWKGLVAGSTRL